MAVTVTMPQLGETVTEGTILSWAKQPGDMVEEDEVLLEISTDKVDTEVPSPAAGVLQEILVAEGETVSVGTPLAVLAEAGEDAAPPASAVVEPEPISTHTSHRAIDDRGAVPDADTESLVRPRRLCQPVGRLRLELRYRQRFERAQDHRPTLGRDPHHVHGLSESTGHALALADRKPGVAVVLAHLGPVFE